MDLYRVDCAFQCGMGFVIKYDAKSFAKNE